jgi:hypothetical protein
MGTRVNASGRELAGASRYVSLLVPLGCAILIGHRCARACWATGANYPTANED